MGLRSPALSARMVCAQDGPGPGLSYPLSGREPNERGRSAEIARRLGVWYPIVSDWRDVWRRSGRDGLRAAGRAGRLPKVKREQLDQVETQLAKGAEANGYPNDVWTLQRVAEVIECTTGVHHHPARVWYILPSVRATWAPRGQTRVLRHRFSWKRLSLAGALAYEPDGTDAHLVFELRPGAYTDALLIEFLSNLNEVEQRPVLLIWDGLPASASQSAHDRLGRHPT